MHQTFLSKYSREADVLIPIYIFQGDLVEYYYIWKKTPSAMSSRPHRRRRHNVLRRRNITRSTKTSSSEFGKIHRKTIDFPIIGFEWFVKIYHGETMEMEEPFLVIINFPNRNWIGKKHDV